MCNQNDYNENLFCITTSLVCHDGVVPSQRKHDVIRPQENRLGEEQYAIACEHLNTHLKSFYGDCYRAPRA